VIVAKVWLSLKSIMSLVVTRPTLKATMLAEANERANLRRSRRMARRVLAAKSCPSTNRRTSDGSSQPERAARCRRPWPPIEAGSVQENLVAANSHRSYLNSSRHRWLRDKAVETAEVLDEAFVKEVFNKDQFGRDLLDRKQFVDGKAFICEVARRIEFALRKLADFYKKKGAKHRQPVTNAPSPKDGLQPVEKAPQPTGTDDLTLEYHEQWNQLLLAIESLDEPLKEVFRLRHISKLSRHDAAEALGVSDKTVTRRYGQALDQIAQIVRTLPAK
jgi:RNA polymerase sigma factor (sigma-70 family)